AHDRTLVHEDSKVKTETYRIPGEICHNGVYTTLGGFCARPENTTCRKRQQIIRATRGGVFRAALDTRKRPSPSSPVQAQERVAAASCLPSFCCSSPSSASSRPPFPDCPSSAAFGRSSLGYPSSRGPTAKPLRRLTAADLERSQPRKPSQPKSLTRELP